MEEDVTPEQINVIQKRLTERYEHKQEIFQGEDDPVVKKYVEELWRRIVASKKLDLVPAEKLSRMVNIDTLQHSNAREIGAENIAYQTWEKLQLTELLLSQGFPPEQATLAATQVVSRAVYPASELKTARWIMENSAVCELTGYDTDKITKDRLYESLMGYKTLYGNTSRLLSRLKLSKVDGTYLKELRKLQKIDLLILDDFGLQAFDATAREIMMDIIDDRFNETSTIVSSQIPVS